MKQHVLFTETELRVLFTRKEGQFIEFKSLWDRSKGKDNPHVLDRRKTRDLVAEYVAAFANADGGTLILGVEDNGRVTGYAYPEEAIKDLLAVPERRLRPPVPCRYQRAVIDEKEILIFQVPIAAKAVMVEANGFPYRVGDQVIKEPQEVINARKEAYRRVGYEQRVRPDTTFEDIDLDLVREFASRTVFQKRSLEEVLEHYGLILPRANGFAITNE
jgi:ATP-dependent DNA helicase RecG